MHTFVRSQVGYLHIGQDVFDPEGMHGIVEFHVQAASIAFFFNGDVRLYNLSPCL